MWPRLQEFLRQDMYQAVKFGPASDSLAEILAGAVH